MVRFELENLRTKILVFWINILTNSHYDDKFTASTMSPLYIMFLRISFAERGIMCSMLELKVQCTMHIAKQTDSDHKIHKWNCWRNFHFLSKDLMLLFVNLHFQVAASMKKDVDAQIPNYPNLPSKLLCRLHNVILLVCCLTLWLLLFLFKNLIIKVLISLHF